MAHLVCPSCGTTSDFENAQRGKVVICPRCQLPFRVRGPAGSETVKFDTGVSSEGNRANSNSEKSYEFIYLGVGCLIFAIVLGVLGAIIGFVMVNNPG